MMISLSTAFDLLSCLNLHFSDYSFSFSFPLALLHFFIHLRRLSAYLQPCLFATHALKNLTPELSHNHIFFAFKILSPAAEKLTMQTDTFIKLWLQLKSFSISWYFSTLTISTPFHFLQGPYVSFFISADGFTPGSQMK